MESAQAPPDFARPASGWFTAPWTVGPGREPRLRQDSRLVGTGHSVTQLRAVYRAVWRLNRKTASCPVVPVPGPPKSIRSPGSINLLRRRWVEWTGT